MKKTSETNEYGQNISVKNANLWYGDFQAIKNISVGIPEKQVTAFIGPSGCGKSTFLKCFNRMNDLIDGCRITGEFLIGNTDIYGKIDVNELRKNVGMVFQKPNPFPMSVYDNVAYGPRTFGITKRAALDEIVEKSLRQAAMWDELKDRLTKSALGLSGGQQQRLCIAALARGDAENSAHGRTDFRSRPYLDGKNRRTHRRSERKSHDSHSYAQHATSDENRRQNGVFPARRTRGIRRQPRIFSLPRRMIARKDI